MLFADDFEGVSESKGTLQKLIDVVCSYCNRWRLKANVSKKNAAMLFVVAVCCGKNMYMCIYMIAQTLKNI